jgi:hypothetical protein
MNGNRQSSIAWLPVVISLIIGVALGLFYGWVISPVQWIDADPSYLRSDLQQEWVRLTADSFKINGNAELARQRLAALGSKAGEVFNATTGSLDPMIVPSLQAVLPTADTSAGSNTQASRSLVNVIATFCGALLLLAILGYGLYTLLQNRNALPRVATQSAPVTESTSGRYSSNEPLTPLDQMADAEASDDAFYDDISVDEQPSAALTDKTAGSTRPVLAQSATGPLTTKSLNSTPIVQFTTTYMLGDDLYDESFSIDDANGDFLGECGVGVGETIGVGEPKKVTAFEVWLFDKNDIRTVTKVLMSNHAYQDENVRAKLSTKGEPVLLEPGKTIQLETATLNVSARVVDLQYGGGSLPNNSYLQQLIVELIAYKKS